VELTTQQQERVQVEDVVYEEANSSRITVVYSAYHLDAVYLNDGASTIKSWAVHPKDQLAACCVVVGPEGMQMEIARRKLAMKDERAPVVGEEEGQAPEPPTAPESEDSKAVDAAPGDAMPRDTSAALPLRVEGEDEKDVGQQPTSVIAEHASGNWYQTHKQTHGVVMCAVKDALTIVYIGPIETEVEWLEQLKALNLNEKIFHAARQVHGASEVVYKKWSEELMTAKVVVVLPWTPKGKKKGKAKKGKAKVKSINYACHFLRSTARSISLAVLDSPQASSECVLSAKQLKTQKLKLLRYSYFSTME